MPWLLHFRGEGYAAMAGVREYVYVLEEEDEEAEDPAPGFELVSKTEIADLPSSFPMETLLVSRG